MPRFNDNSALLLKTCIDSGITDAQELANIMGNSAAETDDFKVMNENVFYKSAERLIRKVRSADDRYTMEEIKAAIKSQDPVLLATILYENRPDIGNTEPGDGWKYLGRGFFQVTGRDNYQRFGKKVGVDLVSHPEIAADPVLSAKLAVLYWKNSVPEAARLDVTLATEAINGRHNGLERRIAGAERWAKTITPELVQDIRTGQITLDHLSFHGWDALKDGKLRPDERGMEVRELQHHLNALGIADAKGRSLNPNGTFDRPTQEAAEIFQRQLGMPARSEVTVNTLKAAEFYAGAPEILRKPLQPVQESNTHEPLHDSKHHIPRGAPPSYNNDWLERDAQGLPNYLHTRAASDPSQTVVPEPSPNVRERSTSASVPHHDADPHPGARSTALGAPGRSRADREPEPELLQPQLHTQRDMQPFSAGHRDYALFEVIRRQLPEQYSDDMAAHATLQAKKGGISRPDQIAGMAVENGRLTVMGKSGMDFAVVELTTSAPPLQETVQQSATFDRQHAIQLAQFQEQQQQMNMGRGPSMTL